MQLGNGIYYSTVH